MGNTNIVTQRFEPDTLMSDSNQLINPVMDNSPSGIFQTSSNSAKSPTSPFSSPNFTSTPNTNSPNPTSPVGLSLVLALETNSLDQAKNIVFSPNLRLKNVPISGTPEIVPIPENIQEGPMNTKLNPPPVIHGPLTIEEIMFSEDYTCIRVFNGPNPRVIHIFRDYILKSHPLDPAAIRTANSHHSSSSNLGLTDGLYLKNCYMCKKAHLRQNSIYLYRDMAFCSEECRYQKIWLDRHLKMMKKRANRALGTVSSNFTTCTGASSTSQEVVFFVSDKPKSQSWQFSY